VQHLEYLKILFFFSPFSQEEGQYPAFKAKHNDVLLGTVAIHRETNARLMEHEG